MEKYDFSGWATKVNIKCSDGRTIMKDAFAHNDGKIVPLVWNHVHSAPENVIGHALLENCPEGVYAYGTFNDTESGQISKALVEHGDVVALSIYANHLQEQGKNVMHGAIREVSLVLAGANPEAFIDNIIQHDDNNVAEAIIYNGEPLDLVHATTEDPTVDENGGGAPSEESAKSDKPETIGDIFKTLNEKQKDVVYVMIAKAVEESVAQHSDDEESSEADTTTDPEPEPTDPEPSDPTLTENADDVQHDDTSTSEESSETIEGGNTTMKHNLFDAAPVTNDEGKVLSHDDMEAVITDGKRYGSLRDSALQHGITSIDYLFPDAKAVDGNVPGFITRESTWVSDIMNGFHHTPFSRIKSIFADLTTEDARAKGYIKGKLKVEEVFSLLKRTTTPTTVYKKQKMDRDDVVDITDFDVVVWLKSEMRIMLDEEIARAALVGDGRLSSSDDKVNDLCIRPIWTDADLFTIKATVDVASADSAKPDVVARAFIRAAIKSRKGYKGSGSPTLYTTEDVLTDCLLIEDTTGRVIYDTVDKLATTLRVKKIVTVPVMEDLTRSVEGTTHTLMGIIVNPSDYNIGADKGGAINLFDDFDIDYNAQKYLIETRVSGALTVPYSAIALELVIT